MTQPPTTPPLTWLRAFEAAARLGSLKSAAGELSVTPSTISHHIRDLEARLGVPLFTKQGRGVALTAEGEHYFRTLRQALELLRGSVVESTDQPRRLRIGCFPFLANEVIVPRLDELQGALSGATITLRSETHLDALLDPLPANRLDVLIRYGNGDFPGCPAQVVFESDSYHAAALAVERGAGICLGILPFMRPWFAARRVPMIGALTTSIDGLWPK